MDDERIDRSRVTLCNDVACIYWCAKLRADVAAIKRARQALGGNQPRAIARWLQEHHLCRLAVDGSLPEV